ncbi:MAG: hypothetical protein K0S68_512 [Candidatus Saccharibacteria bacterium]|nr:hypothetical protein [Candidatus Saccharibacteria bacterium]
MLVFLLANLPLPIIIYLELLVTLRFLKVRHLARHRHVKIKKPQLVKLGWWVGNSAAIFAILPAIVERQIFVQNPAWLISYATAAALTIVGLVMMNRGLGQELRQLSRRKR